MLGLIVFGLKLLFAAIIGGALSYVPGEEGQYHKIVETSLICIFSAAIMGLSSQLSATENNLPMGFGILTIVLVLISISKNIDFTNQMVRFFAGTSGMIIGSGYILQSIILAILVYIIFHNSSQFMNYLNQETNKSDDNTIENVSN